MVKISVDDAGMEITGACWNDGQKKFIRCVCGVAFQRKGILNHSKGCGSIDPFFGVPERADWPYPAIVLLLETIGRLETATGRKGVDALREYPDSPRDTFFVMENQDDYEGITGKWIDQSLSQLSLVYDFLERRKAADRVIFEDPDKDSGFILATDVELDFADNSEMHLVAIVHRHGIRSIRDLTKKDLPMLKNMRDKGLAEMCKKYNVRRDQIVMYFDYLPCYYHLHMHFVILTYNAPACGVTTAIPLKDVIVNLTAAGDYYKRATLPFTLKKSDKLLEMFRAAGRVTVE